jgi:hypothetical protein
VTGLAGNTEIPRVELVAERNRLGGLVSELSGIEILGGGSCLRQDLFIAQNQKPGKKEKKEDSEKGGEEPKSHGGFPNREM